LSISELEHVAADVYSWFKMFHRNSRRLGSYNFQANKFCLEQVNLLEWVLVSAIATYLHTDFALLIVNDLDIEFPRWLHTDACLSTKAGGHVSFSMSTVRSYKSNGLAIIGWRGKFWGWHHNLHCIALNHWVFSQHNANLLCFFTSNPSALPFMGRSFFLIGYQFSSDVCGWFSIAPQLADALGSCGTFIAAATRLIKIHCGYCHDPLLFTSSTTTCFSMFPHLMPVLPYFQKHPNDWGKWFTAWKDQYFKADVFPRF